MEDVHPRDEKAVVVWVVDKTIEFWPARSEYFLSVSGSLSEFFEVHGQDVRTAPEPTIRIIVATAMRRWANFEDYRKDPSLWKQGLEIFSPISGNILTLPEVMDLGYRWYKNFLTREEYYEHRKLMR